VVRKKKVFLSVVANTTGATMQKEIAYFGRHLVVNAQLITSGFQKR
jgi:hypothetical protein